MKRIITTIIILVCVQIGFAQSVSTYDYHKYSNVIYDNSGAPRLMELRSNYTITFKCNPESDQTKNPGLIWLRNELGLNKDNSFKLIRKEIDQLGTSHYRFQQLYKGIEVDGAVYLVHTKQDKVTLVNGHVLPGISLSVNADITESVAFSSALNSVGASVYRWDVENIAKPSAEMSIIKTESGYSACYKFDIYAYSPFSRDHVFVDIKSGEVVKTRSQIFHADEVGTGKTKYSGTQQITTFNDGTKYLLKEDGRGIETYNINNTDDYDNATIFENNSKDWDLGEADQAAVDAHFGAEITYDYYLDVHQRKSLDGNGMIIKSYVHYNKEFTNAFWDGERMTYGDGNSQIGVLTTTDICTHEMTHGVVQYTAALENEGESASLNESFADIFATLVEQHAFPNIDDSLNFLIGEQVVDKGIRSLQHPKNNDAPDTYKGTNWDETGQKGPHINGVVQSHWFYLLVMGGTGTNDNSDNYTVSGIGREKAGAIVYRSLSTYLTPKADYMDARLFSIQAAKDLYGSCSDEVKQVTNAWHAVGVGKAYSSSVKADFDFKIVACSDPFTVNFANLSTSNSSSKWDFGDGSTSTEESPTHEYAKAGTYTVYLETQGCDGGFDVMEKQDAIKANNGISCDTTLLNKTGGIEKTACYGVLFDSGGKDKAYESNSNGSITIAPPGASKIKISFSVFDMGGFTDQVRIYDGPNTSSPVLGTYDFFNKPPTEGIESTGGVMTIQEITDGNTEFDGQGFEGYWECESTVGIDKVNADKVAINVYPNPSSGIFDIAINIGDINEYAVYDATGKKVAEQSFSSATNQVTVNLESLPNGVYHLVVFSNSVSYSVNLAIVSN